MSDAIYIITVECPRCENRFDVVERLEDEVPVDQDVIPTAHYCQECGQAVPYGRWDVVEEARVQTIDETGVPARQKTSCNGCGEFYPASFTRCPNCGTPSG